VISRVFTTEHKASFSSDSFKTLAYYTVIYTASGKVLLVKTEYTADFFYTSLFSSMHAI